MKQSVVDRPPGIEHSVIAAGRTGEHLRAQMSGGAHSADPNVPHAGDAAQRPLLHDRLEARRRRPDPEFDGKIVGVEIADFITKRHLAVDTVEGERLADKTITEQEPPDRDARVRSLLVDRPAFSAPPTR